MGYRLPEQYRTWLKDTSGGRLEAMLDAPFPDGDAMVDGFHGPKGAAEGYRFGLATCVPPHYLCVSTGAGGAYCIEVEGSTAGAVYWADFEGAMNLVAEDEYSEEIMVRQADDWESFLAMIEAAPFPDLE